MFKPLRVSLANKCQLLFGAAVLLIIIAALAVAWIRMNGLVRDGQLQRAREVAEAWISQKIKLNDAMGGLTAFGLINAEELSAFSEPSVPPEEGAMSISPLPPEEWSSSADPFIAEAAATFAGEPDRKELFTEARTEKGVHYYRYARAIRKDEYLRISGREFVDPGIGTGNALHHILLIQLRADAADKQLLINQVFIIAGGLLAALFAIATFWFITTRLILSPVRVLKTTAEKVREGDLNIRSEISTGDEFEELSDTFNGMLESLRISSERLRTANKSLDLKLGELAETNVALYEANKIKTEFLANVSHELRTPLNSIIGFAEVLQEVAPAADEATQEKRKRYLKNIIVSSRRLLDLINDLLDLAKIEAGRIELHPSRISLSDTCEGLLNLIRPQAEKRRIRLKLQLDANIPVVETDPGKLQQILFNFLSNAIKFTPPGGVITLAATSLGDGVARQDDNGDETTPPERSSGRVCLSVTDTGPGISLEDQDRVFEKFTQLDPSKTREHGGTGLGLTISRDLAKLLQGEIRLDSDVGKGATFSLIIPLQLEQKEASLMPASPRGAAVP